jgi:4-amino-4-deoxy-L-arabinose transferase-like glycosyltransferase
LWAILLLAFVFRCLLLVWVGERGLVGDEILYKGLAHSLLSGQGLSLPYAMWGTVQPYRLTSTWVPVYPAFLAFSLWLFWGNLLLIKILQILFSVLSVWLVYRLGREMFNEYLGLGAAFLFAVNPFCALFSVLLMSETVFIFWVVAFFVFLVWVYKQNGRSWWYFAGLGVLAALSALTRESFSIIFAWSILWLLIFLPDKKRVALGVALAFLTTLLMISPWLYRNYCVHGQLVFTTKLGYNLYVGTSEKYTITDWQMEFPVMHDSASEVERNQILMGAALRQMRHWPVVLKNAGVKFIGFWQVIPNDPDNRLPLITWVGLAYYLPLFVLAALGVFFGFRGKFPYQVLLLGFMAVYTAVHLLIIAGIRMRLPLEFALGLYAARGGQWSLSWLSGWFSANFRNGKGRK